MSDSKGSRDVQNAFFDLSDTIVGGTGGAGILSTVDCQSFFTRPLRGRKVNE